MNRITLAVKSALGLAMLAPPALALAQAAPVAPANTLEEVVVTGFRRSLEASLDVKRQSDNLVEVVTAEDIGKMPDKNIADSLQRVPGVTISSASAGEGGFDENDRVSMRGTNPSLTQTLINGHNVAAGDWFVLNQTGTVGRSVSYTLLPSELVSQVVVRKSSEASLVEGGVAGSVDIITRKPLDFAKPLTFEASAGAVYSDLPSKTDPQLSGLFNWRNDDKTIGVMVQAFSETRHLRRDGVEILGYSQIAPTSAVATAHPDLANVWYPDFLGAAFFEQKRERKGGLLDVQFKPTDNLNFDLSGFLSDVNAPNYNRNYLVWVQNGFVHDGAGQSPDAGYVVRNNTLVSANYTGVSGTNYGIYDQISRPDEKETTYFINLDGNWRVSERLSIDGQLGHSEGDGKTPTQNVAETVPDVGQGAGWTLQGLGSAPNFNLGTTNNTTPFPNGTPVAFGWIFGAQDIDVKDKEDWVKLDATMRLDGGPWEDLKFGARHESHSRVSLGAIAQGPTFSGPNGGGTSTANYPTTWQNYPSDFNTFGGSIPTGVWYWTPAQLAAYNGTGLVQRDPVARAYPDFWFQLHEKNDAAYIQADLKGSGWSANFGLRYVRTQEDTVNYEQDSSVLATTPGAVTTSLFGPYIARPASHTYNDLLPSANLKLELAKDLIARFAAAETMTRPDYSALAGATTLGSPPVGNVAGGGSTSNPDLKPIRSTNLDAGIEWYFAKRSLLSATLFYMDLRNYISYGSVPLNALSFSNQYPQGQNLNYIMTVPINSKGRVGGLELAYQQALTDHIGVAANYTYADGKQTSDVVNGDDRLVGTSKNTYNLSAYYEDAHFSARVAYNYRSAYFSGLDRSSAFSMDATGYLSASLAYTVNDNLSFTLDGQNLNNPTLKYYALNTDQPRAFYTNGRQYYLNVRVKF
ncbi:MAG: TonB-dependent receptor [Proteobacteria bacterium]|nr:TonB-dependent receptor [Pseudomonadota bacterium]